jgi:hypothetical protein
VGNDPVAGGEVDRVGEGQIEVREMTTIEWAERFGVEVSDLASLTKAASQTWARIGDDLPDDMSKDEVVEVVLDADNIEAHAGEVLTPAARALLKSESTSYDDLVEFFKQHVFWHKRY